MTINNVCWLSPDWSTEWSHDGHVMDVTCDMWRVTAWHVTESCDAWLVWHVTRDMWRDTWLWHDMWHNMWLVAMRCGWLCPSWGKSSAIVAVATSSRKIKWKINEVVTCMLIAYLASVIVKILSDNAIASILLSLCLVSIALNIALLYSSHCYLFPCLSCPSSPTPMAA